MAPLLAGVLGLVVEVFLIRRLYKRDPLYSLLLTFGLALIMQDVTAIVQSKGVPLSIPGIAGTSPQSDLLLHRLPPSLSRLPWWALLCCSPCCATPDWASAFAPANADLETVSALGVNIYLLRTANFVIGIVFAGVAGILAAGQSTEPTMGDGLLMPAFVAIVVGGVGSLLGSLLGGLLIGVASGITTAYFPAASEAVIYLIMGLMPVVRPRGLMGQEGLFE